MTRRSKKAWKRSKTGDRDWRIGVFRWGLALFALGLAGRLFFLQVIDHGFYQALASGQHEIFQELFPSRGSIYIQDLKDEALVPIATNHQLAFVYADPRHIDDPKKTAQDLGEIFGYDDDMIDALEARLDHPEDPYEPIERSVEDHVLDQVLALDLPGIAFLREEARIYPEPLLGGHVVGFVGSDGDGSLSGKYGIEGYWNAELSGSEGFLRSERDISGRLITVGEHSLVPAVDGSDIVLTIDRTIQFQVCSMLRSTVERHEASSGSVIILEPSTGKILAMCGAPDFDPNHYNLTKDFQTFNNQVTFGAYEAGSVMKTFTIAAGLDAKVIEPNSTFEDTGEAKIDIYTIKNSDGKANGIQTMTEVLEKSLNTGVIYVMRAMGRERYIDYVHAFGFGKKTGISLDTESAGDVSPLDINHEIYAATAAYGQGITVTPLQLAAAYAAVANGGILMKPYIVSEIRSPDGTVEKRQPQAIRRVIEQKTATLLSAMLVSVVEHGHAGNASVDGYYVAGKTGTAQVPKSDGPGYREDVNIGTFAGFAPAENPRFVAIVRIDHAKNLLWADSTAAPLFAEISNFLFEYFEISPTRAIKH